MPCHTRERTAYRVTPVSSAGIAVEMLAASSACHWPRCISFLYRLTCQIDPIRQPNLSMADMVRLTVIGYRISCVVIVVLQVSPARPPATTARCQ